MHCPVVLSPTSLWGDAQQFCCGPPAGAVPESKTESLASFRRSSTVGVIDGGWKATDGSITVTRAVPARAGVGS